MDRGYRAPKVPVYCCVFLVAAGAGLFLSQSPAKPDVAHAQCGFYGQQKDNFLAYAGYFMHQWLYFDEEYCPFNYNYKYHYGMDSRWSWGGAGRNMTELGMLPRRAWKCGSLFYNQRASVFNTYYHYAETPWSGWSGCGPQADFQARFYKSGVIDWWPYLNF